MKLSHPFLTYPLVLVLLLTSILSISLSSAQQTEVEMPVAIPVEPNPAPGENAGQQTTANPENGGAASAPTTTRFTPTEKIHADDAVSFPVDI